MKKKLRLCKKKLMGGGQEKVTKANIIKDIQDRNKISHLKKQANIIKSYAKDTFMVLEKVKERRAREKQYMENAENIIFKNVLLIYDVNKINQRLNYEKFLYDNPV